MLSLFRTNQAYAGLLLFIYALVLWLPLFFGGDAVPTEITGDGIWGTWTVGLFEGQPVLAVFATILLVGFQGIQLNAWAARHQLSRVVTQFPGLFMVLTTALVLSFHPFSSFLFANLFMLFGLLSIGRLYKKEEPAVALFNAGAWLGVASLFRPEYLLFIPAFIAGIGILRRIEFTRVLQLITGVAIVYFFLFVTAYFKGVLADSISFQFSHFGLLSLQVTSTANLIGLGILALLILGVILGYGSISMMLNIEGSKNTKLLAWMLASGTLILTFSGTVTAANAQVLVVPLGALLGLGLVSMKQSRAEVVHLLLFAAAMLPVVLRVSW